MGRRYGVPATLASRGARHGDDAENVRDRVWYAVHAEFELALADLRAGLRAAQPRRACRQRDGFPRGDGLEPLRQDRARDEPHPQSLELRAQSQPHAAARRGRRAPADRGDYRGRQRQPTAVLSLSRQYREDGGPGLAGADRGYERDRHRSPLCAGTRAGKTRERDFREPGEPHDPDRRLSRRVAARPAAHGGELCRVVARDRAPSAQRRAGRDRA